VFELRQHARARGLEKGVEIKLIELPGARYRHQLVGQPCRSSIFLSCGMGSSVDMKMWLFQMEGFGNDRGHRFGLRH
jgi:hypothetical protein